MLTSPGNFVTGCNYWASHAGTAMWSDWQPDVVDADLRQLAEGGLQVLRVFPLWPDFQPIHLLRGGEGRPREVRLGENPLPDDPIGQAGMSPVMLERFAAFADMADRHGLKLIVGLLTGWMSGRLFVPPALEGLNVLTDPFARVWETRFVRAFVRRFKAHPAVEAWDLGNECNVMAPVPDRESAWAWVSAITDAIRAEDPTRPVVSGMHGGIDRWSPEVLGELTDLLTTHPYPYFTPHADNDPVNSMRTILHSTAESRFYADTSGKPCLAEELGTLGSAMASDRVAADFARACLFSLWAHDCHGLLWWCAYDQGHLAHAPYDWNTCERELGLIRADRSVKPVLDEMRAFRRWLDGLAQGDSPRLPGRVLPARTREAVCLLSADQDQWGAAYSTFVLARQAGFDVEFQQAEAPLKDAALYLVPSVRGINVISRRRWLALIERVRAGASLYLSVDNALIWDFKATFGLEIQSRRRRPDGAVRFSVDGPGSFTLPAAFRQDFVPAGAEVLGAEPDGNPVFTRFVLGKGEVFFLACPLETSLADAPGAIHDPEAPPLWEMYRRAAETALKSRAVRKTHPQVGLTEHRLADGSRVVAAINYSAAPVEDTLTLAPGWRIDQRWYGEISDDARLRLDPQQAAVFLILPQS